LLLAAGLVDAGHITLPTVVHENSSGKNGLKPNLHIFNQYVLRVERRDELREWLCKNDIGCEIYYPVPLHKQGCLAAPVGAGQYPEAEKAADETIALPIYPELTEAMQTYVAEKIVQFYK
jgi:dTDP-4-amino-4,6-dideoxygalactose transaminase